jgi:WD40 repeat protein
MSWNFWRYGLLLVVAACSSDPAHDPGAGNGGDATDDHDEPAGGTQTGGAHSGGTQTEDHAGSGGDGGAQTGGDGGAPEGGDASGGRGGDDGGPAPNWVAFSNQEGVFVYDARTFPATDTAVRLAGSNVEARRLSWSPDGRTLLYHDTPDLFAVDMSGEAPAKPRWLLSNGSINKLEWSADSRSVAIDISGALSVFDPKRAPIVLHPIPAEIGGTALRWAPVGNKLLCSHREWASVVSVDSGEPGTPIPLALTNEVWAPDGNAVWSPDGRMLAGNSWDKTVLVHLNENTASLDVLAPETAGNLSFSPDGKKLAWNARSAQQVAARYIDLTQPNATPVPLRPSMELWPSEGVSLDSLSPWSADSQAVVLSVLGFGQVVQTLAGDPSAPLRGYWTNPTWAPSPSQRILYGIRTFDNNSTRLVRFDAASPAAIPRIFGTGVTERLGSGVPDDYTLNPSGSRAIARNYYNVQLIDLNHPSAVALDLPIGVYWASGDNLANVLRPTWSRDGRFVALADKKGQPQVIRFDGLNPAEAATFSDQGERVHYAWQPGSLDLDPGKIDPDLWRPVNCDGTHVGNASFQKDLSAYGLERTLSDITTIRELRDFCSDLFGGNYVDPDIQFYDCVLDLSVQGVGCGATLGDYIAYVRHHDCSGLAIKCPEITISNSLIDDEVTFRGPGGYSIKGQLDGQAFSLPGGYDDFNGFGTDNQTSTFTATVRWPDSAAELWGNVVTKKFEGLLRLAPPAVDRNRLICVRTVHMTLKKETWYTNAATPMAFFDGDDLSEIACDSTGGAPVDLVSTYPGGGGPGTIYGQSLPNVSVSFYSCSGHLCYGSIGLPTTSFRLVMAVDTIAPIVTSEDGKVEEREQVFKSSHLIGSDGHGQVSCGSGGTVHWRKTQIGINSWGDPYYRTDVSLHMDHLSAPSTCPGTPVVGSFTH